MNKLRKPLRDAWTCTVLAIIFILFLPILFVIQLIRWIGRLIEKLAVKYAGFSPKLPKVQPSPLIGSLSCVAPEDEWRLDFVEILMLIEDTAGIEIATSDEEEDKVHECFLKQDKSQILSILKEKTKNQISDTQWAHIEKEIERMHLLPDKSEVETAG